MTPTQAIAQLDRQIVAHGQAVTLKRLSPAFSGDLRAFVRGYRAEELSGGIQQGDSTMLISPTALAASGFPGAPKRLDKVVIAGRTRNIEIADPVEIDGQVVRWNCWVKG